jgi:type VI secretion system VgrG family protein
MKPFVMQVRLESAAFEPATVHVARLSGTERISRLFEFELKLVTAEERIDQEKLLTSLAALVFERRAAADGQVVELRRIPGIIRAVVEREASIAHDREYVATFVPRAWRATLSSTSDVCMDLSVPEVIQKKLLEGAGLQPGTDVELRLSRPYPVREFVVQYKETNLDFVSRLAEDVGIHSFFEVEGGREVWVFADDNAAFKPGTPAVAPFNPRGPQTDVYALEARLQLVTTNFVARDYNYRNPSMDVLGQAQITSLGLGKYDEYGPHAKTPEEAAFYARVRAEEAASRSLTFEGKSELPGLRAGSVVTVEDHPRGDLDLVITEVVHHFEQTVFMHQGASSEPTYANTFRALPRDVTYRPPRITPKPIVHGVVNGVIEAESATKLGAVDDQGRYRVMFMYDSVTGRGDGKASRPLRMAQPSAAADRGFHTPLKTGTEVMIICVNGDPDRPVIVGAVPNPQTPSPVSSSNSEKSIWTTNVNSIVIDDHSARCKINVNVDAHVIQMGAPEAPEVGVLIGSESNVSTVADGDKTEASKNASIFVDEFTIIAAKNILEVAGVPQPMSLWNKAEKAAEKAADYVKGVAEQVDKMQEAFDLSLMQAKEDKEEADAKLEEARKKVMEDLKIEEKAKPQALMYPDGRTRRETAEEAQHRTLIQELRKPQNKASLDELNGAVEGAVAAEENVESHKIDAVKKVEKEKKKLLDQMKEIGETGSELADGKVGKHAGKLPGKAGEYGEHVAKALDAVGELKKVEEAIKKMPAAQKLFSALGKIFSAAALEAFDATVAASQKLSGAVGKAAGQRSPADVGSFAKPFNLQFSKHSASLYGARNAFVFGGGNATVFSPLAACVLGTQRVDVKSRALVEVAAKTVMLTGKEVVDVHASQKMKLVAHTADKKIDVPGGFTMYLHSKEGILMDSVEKDIEAKAKKAVKVQAEQANIELTAKEKNIEMTAKQVFKVKAEEGEINLQAAKGRVEIMSDKDQATLRAKKRAMLQSLDENVTVTAKTKCVVTGEEELNLTGQKGSWRTTKGSIEITAKGGDFVAKGAKVQLG